MAILGDALQNITDTQKRTLFSDGWTDKYTLIKALTYPDFPCGNIELSSDGKTLDDSGMDVCSLAEMGMAMMFDKLSMSNQTHNGFYSVWHAMTFDPEKTLENVAKNVCEYVIICCKLAAERRSLFWLGFALHIVMDAYSPAHTLRKKKPASFSSAPVRLSPEEASNIKHIQGIIRRVVTGVDRGHSYRRIVNSQPPDARPMTVFVLFDHVQRRSLPFKVNMTACHGAPRKKNDRASPNRITHFYFFPRQSYVQHSTDDRISAIKAAGLYDACVHDVTSMLRLFADVSSGKTKTGAYLRSVCALMCKRTLATV